MPRLIQQTFKPCFQRLLVAVLALASSACIPFGETSLGSLSPQRSIRVAQGKSATERLQTKTTGAAFAAPAMVGIVGTGPQGFLMGSPSTEVGHQRNEKQHTVVLKNAFALGQAEVTFDEWAQCTADGGCQSNPRAFDNGFGRGQRPVTGVSYDDIQAYLEWLNDRAGTVQRQTPSDTKSPNIHPHRYRLPTEAEWEWAARAGQTGPFGFAGGANISPQLARYDTRASYQGSATAPFQNRSAPVKTYAPSGNGLYDMHGNVWEWVGDCEDDYDRVQGKADGSAHREFDVTCSYRVLRGGSWNVDPRELRTATRFRLKPSNGQYFAGFRLARKLAPY